jgi:hypothetical protein
MLEEVRVKISREELNHGEIPMNQVLCEAFYSAEGAKTKSGIVYGFNTDVLYGSEDGLDTSSHIADLAETCLRVYKTPQKLYFDKDDVKSMDWECDMDLRAGDLVWTNPIEAKNATCVECEGKLYKFIPYQEHYVSLTEYWDLRKKIGQKITCLNGYLLCEQVNKESLSALDVLNNDKIDPRRGIVRYVGKPNKQYKDQSLVDFPDIKEGDLVVFDRRCSPFLLERQLYSAKFSQDKLYWVIPRKYVAMILERGL